MPSMVERIPLSATAIPVAAWSTGEWALRHWRAMNHGYRLGLAGFVLALGAPLGSMAIHFVLEGFPPFGAFVARDWSNHLFCYVYMTIGTTLAFTLFGYVVGRMSDQCETDLQAREKELKQIHLKRCVDVCQAERLAALGRVSSMLAHEINNPLMGVRNASTALANGQVPEQRKREYFELILAGLDKIHDAFSDLLNLTRPGGNGVRPGPVNVALPLDTALKLSVAALTASKIAVSVDRSPDTPDAFAEANALSQVFLNLILNARDATTEGGRLDIEIRPEGNRVQIHFHDSGSGIHPRHLNRLFEPFFTTKPHGTGLGLAVCRNLLEKMKGEIAASNHPTGGALFTVTLRTA